MISIVFPLFNEQDNLRELYRRVSAVTGGLPDLEFEEDQTERTAERIEELIRELHREEDAG